MNIWKPKHFKPEYPSSEEHCAFVLGGYWDGKIVQENPLPYNFDVCAPTADPEMRTMERYRLERIMFDGTDVVYFYVIENQPLRQWLIMAMTSLSHFRQQAREE